MKKILGLLAFWLFTGTANAVLIDFDTLPGGGAIANGTVITNQYSALGVNFSLLENGSFISGAYADQRWASNTENPPNNSGNELLNCYNGSDCSRADILRIEFDSMVNNVSWYTDSEGGVSILFNAYDASDNLLESISVVSLFPSFISTSFTVSGISRIDGLQPSDDWTWGMDNLSFDVAAVPEPTSIVLLGLGLAGIGFSRKKKTA